MGAPKPRSLLSRSGGDGSAPAAIWKVGSGKEVASK